MNMITVVILFYPNLVQHLGNLVAELEGENKNNYCLPLCFLWNLCHVKARASTFKTRGRETMGTFGYSNLVSKPKASNTF